MSEPKADLSGWDLHYDDVAEAAEPGDEVTMYNEKKASRGFHKNRTFEYTATVESVGSRKMTLDDGTKIEKSSLDVVRRTSTGAGIALNRVVVR